MARPLPTRTRAAARKGGPGRFEIVSAPGGGKTSGPENDVTVVVDYAHTDDALKNLLETARPLAKGRLVTVFGCGGDRDRTKRPLMGAVAARLSDLVIVTSDNPRSEDPLRIIAEILDGAGDDVEVEPDRRAAIARALEQAVPGDVVVIAGKGDEDGQEFADQTVPFDDRVVAREVLRRLGART